MLDDRADFEESRRRYARDLAADSEVIELSDRLFAASDRHNFSYVWDWCGLPIIQLPTDILLMQEIIWRCKPTVVIETGVARGGSVIMYSSILRLLGRGRVIGVDIDIRLHNRASIEAHPFGDRVMLIEGSSVDPAVLDQIRLTLDADDEVMVVLDSDHTHAHVLEELNLYSSLVTQGQFLVVADTIVESIPEQTHRPRAWGQGNNPATAVKEFLSSNVDFELDDRVNSKSILSSSRGGYLRRAK